MKISIINPGGVSNFGERAILVGTIYALHDKYPMAEIAVFGYENIQQDDQPMYELMQEFGVRTFPLIIAGNSLPSKIIRVASFMAAPKWTLGKVAYKHLAESSVIYAKGQESLTGSYGMVHLVDSILEPMLASRVNNEVVLYGHSIGPVKGQLQSFIAKAGLRRIKHVFVRDTLSEKALRNLGYPETKITLIKDLAYTAVNQIKELNVDVVPSHYLMIPNAAIIKTPADEARYMATLRTVIKELISRQEKVLLSSSVTATDWNNDYRLCRMLAADYPEVEVREYQTLNDLLLDIKRSKRVVSSRLHPLILATGLKVPVLALSNAPKVIGLLGDLEGGHPIFDPFTGGGKSLKSL